MSDSQKKYCLECNAEVKGRSDKRFCNDYCRNLYHNKQNRDATNYIRRVNNILRKNRRILNKFNPLAKTKIKETTLMEEGFNFAYHTNIYQTKKGTIYFYCYDLGYIKNEDGWLTIVVKKDYVK
jgi:predicted nucleic acid-binding Zn ribbon protein